MFQLHRRLAQAGVLDVRGVRYLRGLVVSHFRSQRRDQHQRILHIPVHLGAIDFDAFDHVLDIAVAGVGDQSDRV